MTTATVSPTISTLPGFGWRYCRRGSDDGFQDLPRRRVLVGDALTELRRLPSGSVDCCLTSPPYFQLRDYAAPGQLGMEPAVDGWVEHLVAVCHEVVRLLTPGGSLWLNLGDSYSRHARYGAPPKSLLCAPERLLLALAQDGWLVRNKVVWAKPNPMPHSVRDRLTTGYEVVYFLTRNRRYYFDLDAIRRPHRSARRPGRIERAKYGDRAYAGPLAGSNSGLVTARALGRVGHPLGKNPGDVWTVATAGFRGAHFAPFPEALVARPLQATCPAAVCAACGAGNQGGAPAAPLPASCACGGNYRPGLVLDPFFGSGTVGLVAERLGRDWLGIELNPVYAALAEQRIREAREITSNQPPAAA